MACFTARTSTLARTSTRTRQSWRWCCGRSPHCRQWSARWRGFYAKVLLAVLAAVWAFRLVSEKGGWGEGEKGGWGEKVRGGWGEKVRGGRNGEVTVEEMPSAEAAASPLHRFTPSPPHPLTPSLKADLARAAAIVVCLPPLLGDLSHNNVNIFILFLVAGCLEAFRRRLDTLAGFNARARHRVQGDAATVRRLLRVEALLALAWCDARRPRAVAGCRAWTRVRLGPHRRADDRLVRTHDRASRC